MCCSTMIPLIATKNHAMKSFLATHGMSALYSDESIESISLYILIGNANDTLQRNDSA